MLLDDDRAAVKSCLHRLGIAALRMESKLEALQNVACSYRRRLEHRAASPRIAEVVRQLAAMEEAAKRACLGQKIELPAEILPETIGALVGRYPFSNLDLARVTMETLTSRGHGHGPFRTAVVGAAVELHVIDAAMHQFPDGPHLVAARAVAFPYAAANAYFFSDLPDAGEANLRGRLESFIIGGPDTALGFIREVHKRVRRATRDPEWQNSGKRSLYQWAEPSPDARLVFDVYEIVLEPLIERPQRAVQSILIELVDLLRAGTNHASDFMRQDVFSSMVTVWVALNQHRLVARRLAAILDGELDSSQSRRRRLRRVRLLAMKCSGAVGDSAAELVRRGYMGDIHDLGHILGGRVLGDLDAAAAGREPARTIRPDHAVRAAPSARASGEPIVTIDLAGIVRIESTFRFIRQLARACMAAEQKQATFDKFHQKMTSYDEIRQFTTFDP